VLSRRAITAMAAQNGFKRRKEGVYFFGGR
jgi:hypothetical protein